MTTQYGATQCIREFSNGYGVSVVACNGYHGVGSMNCGGFELAVLRDGKVDFTTDVTCDVVMHQTIEEIMVLTTQVMNLVKPN